MSTGNIRQIRNSAHGSAFLPVDLLVVSLLYSHETGLLLHIREVRVFVNRIKVLEVATKLGGLGGTEKTLELFTRYMDRGRFEPAVYSWQGLGGPRSKMFDRLDVPFHVDRDLGDVLDEFQPDIVHVHRAGWTEPYVIETATARGVPIIVETNVFGRLDPTPAGQKIDCHLFVSYFCMRRYQEWIGYPLVSDKYKVLYNPIDLDGFERHTERPASRQHPAIGRISRPDNTKWSDITVDMFPRLVELVPDVVYSIIGETPEVRDRFKSLGVEDNVRYLPLATCDEDVYAFYNQIDLLAHGSTIGETFGCTIAEAMAAGIPVVTHNCFGGADNAQVETVDHGVTGLVADSPEAYAEAVAYLLKNAEIAGRLGENGRKKVRTCYDAPMLTRALEEIFFYFYDKKVAGTS